MYKWFPDKEWKVELNIFAGNHDDLNITDPSPDLSKLTSHPQLPEVSLEKSPIYCEHPKIIFNRGAEMFYLQNGMYHTPTTGYCTTEQSDLDAFRLWFPYNVFNALLANVTFDTLDQYFFYDENNEVKPMFIIVPCGHCDLCKEKHRLMWSNRIQMEIEAQPKLPIFVTLTYALEPAAGSCYKDFTDFRQRFIKRVQRGYTFDYDWIENNRTLHYANAQILPHPDFDFRFVVCSEYGEQTGRCHYHLLLFEYPDEWLLHDQLTRTAIKFIEDTWQLGNTFSKKCYNSNAGFYIGKYMLKQDKTPDGKNSTFFRASRGVKNHKGAIGYPIVNYRLADGLTVGDHLRRDPLHKDISWLSHHQTYKRVGKKFVKESARLVTFTDCRYFRDKLFPTVRSYVGVDLYKAIHQYQYWYHHYKAHFRNIPSKFTKLLASLPQQVLRGLSYQPACIKEHFAELITRREGFYENFHSPLFDYYPILVAATIPTAQQLDEVIRQRILYSQGFGFFNREYDITHEKIKVRRRSPQNKLQ